MGQGYEEQVTSDIEDTREDLTRNLDALNEKVNPSRVMERRKEAVRSRFGSMKDKVMGSAQDMRSGAQEARGGMADRASDAAESATDAAQGAVRAVQQRAEGSPLAAGLIAFGAGMLISAVIPASEKESQASQKLIETAKEHGQPVIDEAKSVGREMGENLKEEAGQAAEEVKSSAQESAQHVKEEGQASGRAVKDDAQSRMG
jgi:vacuolar-type H+-ATPase subunit H/uncharacterized protein YjbJ (UPF0337 family)